MKKKILFLIIIGVIAIIVATICIVKFINSKKSEKSTEIIPLEELTEEQERQTMVSLYFINKDTNTLMPEARRIDSKKLLENPYKVLIELLIEGPIGEHSEKSIPEGTKFNNATLNNNVLELDLSKEFIENQGEDREKALLGIESIANTLTELNEVSAVKILIDGESNKKIEELDINLEEIFIR